MARCPTCRPATSSSLGAAGSRRRGRGKPLAARSQSYDGSVAFGVLGLPPATSSKREIRTAYISKMKSLHPDVSQLGTDEATQQATALNLAYEAALASLASSSSNRSRSRVEVVDEFDRTLGGVDQLFVNPFACNADPMLWRELQQAAQAGPSPEEALLARGVYVGPSALQYVTLEQLRGLYAELEDMEMSFQFEATAYILESMLSRAYRANRRQG